MVFSWNCSIYQVWFYKLAITYCIITVPRAQNQIHGQFQSRFVSLLHLGQRMTCWQVLSCGTSFHKKIYLAPMAIYVFQQCSRMDVSTNLNLASCLSIIDVPKSTLVVLCINTYLHTGLFQILHICIFCQNWCQNLSCLHRCYSVVLKNCAVRPACRSSDLKLKTISRAVKNSNDEIKINLILLSHNLRKWISYWR